MEWKDTVKELLHAEFDKFYKLLVEVEVATGQVDEDTEMVCIVFL